MNIKALLIIVILFILSGCADMPTGPLASNLNNVLVCGPGIPVYDSYGLSIKACSIESSDQLSELYIVIQGSLESGEDK